LTSNKTHRIVKDHFKSKEDFELVWNEERDMLITSPQPSPEKVPSYYESEEYISHNDEAKGIMAFLYNAVKKRSLKRKLSLIESRFGEKGMLLDVGAGTGDFCKVALSANWKVEGVEPSEAALRFANEKGVKMYKSLSNVKGRSYDVITLWHVLEHLPNLEDSIKKLSELLNPNGVLIIAVPNYNSFDAKHYKFHWAAFDVPRHLWHFSRQSIPRLFHANFKLETTKPMWFDSFYVSLLSEKYKSGAAFSLRALYIGFLSNLKAVFSKEYSSVIYCLRKQ
jgi:SAM-dependent methyltransferase